MTINAMATEMYGGISPNDFPMYGIRYGSHCLKIAPATLRSWFAGTNRGAFPPVLEPADIRPIKLSFNNLAEAFVLRSLRRDYSVKLLDIRQAISEAEQELGIDRLLLRRDLKTHAGELLIEKFNNYLTLGASGQYAMKKFLDEALDRFIWEDPSFPSMLFPYLPEAARLFNDKVIAINPI